jgi:hypothetical protein
VAGGRAAGAGAAGRPDASSESAPGGGGGLRGFATGLKRQRGEAGADDELQAGVSVLFGHDV